MVTVKDIGKQVRTRTATGLVWTLDAIGSSGDAYARRKSQKGGIVCWRGRAEALVVFEGTDAAPSPEEVTLARSILAQVPYAREVLARASRLQRQEANHDATHEAPYT